MAQHEELMKKTETMNVVMETNKMLREEKLRLEQDLQQMQAKVWDTVSTELSAYSVADNEILMLLLFVGEETGVRYFALTRSKRWAEWEKWYATSRKEVTRRRCQALESS